VNGATRKDLVGAGIALLLALGCVRLGIWQVHRLAQRKARNAAQLARWKLPALTIASRGLPADSADQRRVSSAGKWDYEHERLWRPRSWEGTPGVDLVTPLLLGDGSAVLVDRGWAASPDAYHVDEQAYREGDSGVVVGLALRAPRGRGDVDPARLADSLGVPLLPFVIQELPDSAHPAPRLLRWPLPAIDNGPHLSYAIQWFSFAIIITVGSIALFWRRNVRRPDVEGPGAAS